MRLRTHRVEPDGVVVVSDGAIMFTFSLICEAAIVVGGRKIRVELDRLIVFGNGAVVIASGCIQEAAVDVFSGIFGIGPDDARAMLGELKVAKLLDGFRGRPACDVDAVVAAICGLSDLYLAHRHLVADLEINPLIALPRGKGVRAVDVRTVPIGTTVPG